jgi:hypothetical protein
MREAIMDNMRWKTKSAGKMKEFMMEQQDVQRMKANLDAAIRRVIDLESHVDVANRNLKNLRGWTDKVQESLDTIEKTRGETYDDLDDLDKFIE